MYQLQPKKMLMFNILEILKERTDVNHRLSQKEIEDILFTEYGMSADRKSIKRNLMDIEECGYKLCYSETHRPVINRKTGESEDTIIMSDFYIERDFNDSELRLMIDSLMFSTHIHVSQCKALVHKLERLSNMYFRARVKHISTMPKDNSDNREIFLNIDVIDEAIETGKKIKFNYVEYDTDKKLVVKKNANGRPRYYIINPYQMAAKEGKYYLICNHDKFDDISNYRIDRIKNISIVDEPVRPFETLHGSNGRRLDLTEYMREHIYMYASDTIRAKLRIIKPMVGDMIDLFGKDISFSSVDDEFEDVTVKANETAILQFAQNYAPYVAVIEPESLREKIIERLENGLKVYR